jgi:hypothetical protein
MWSINCASRWAQHILHSCCERICLVVTSTTLGVVNQWVLKTPHPGHATWPGCLPARWPVCCLLGCMLADVTGQAISTACWRVGPARAVMCEA